MNKRYQVFVSSTYLDLSEERLEVIKALLELDSIPCGMEYFPAASEDSWTYIASLIDQCDYYVVIVGGKYGSLTSEGISFTQKEFLYAQSKCVPCIAFIHSDPDDLPAKKTEQTEEKRRKLNDFISLLRKNLCKNWSSTHELGAVVSRSITQLMKRHPRTGWIPANQASDPKVIEEILVLTKKNTELEEELRKVRGKPALDLSTLADGDELTELNAAYVISEESQKGWRRSEIVNRGFCTVSVSWNEIFRAIAPRIAPFANDSNIKAGINGILKDKFIPPPGVIKKDQWISSITLTDDSYNIIKIQFAALGLTTAAKERTPDGAVSGILWRLTELGEARMTHNLAQRKKLN